ncbi:TetR/AcrR family transcriptional regulator [Enemella sp. A6]|uniref:TetR/AcrR family transcriptional regulator n=1 Tax=Enemella sp. A6 TaxID=3440152 RepID=UPI003EBD1DCE
MTTRPATNENAPSEQPRPGRPRSKRAHRSVIEATLGLIEEVGLEALTIEAIATRSGVARTTIYRWWPNTTALVLEAVQELPALVVPDMGNLVEELRAHLKELRRLFLETPLLGLIARAGLEKNRLDPQLDAYLKDRGAQSQEIIRRAMARGELPPDTDPAAFATLINGPLISAVQLGWVTPDDDFLELVIQKAVGGDIQPSGSMAETD